MFFIHESSTFLFPAPMTTSFPSHLFLICQHSPPNRSDASIGCPWGGTFDKPSVQKRPIEHTVPHSSTQISGSGEIMNIYCATLMVQLDFIVIILKIRSLGHGGSGL